MERGRTLNILFASFAGIFILLSIIGITAMSIDYGLFDEKQHQKKQTEEYEKFINEQSKINATITDDEIKDLPLFQTYKNLSKNAKEDVKGYM